MCTNPFITKFYSLILCFLLEAGSLLNNQIKLSAAFLFPTRSLAASAPIFEFSELTNCEAFFSTVTKPYIQASPACADNIRRSWTDINKAGGTGMLVHLVHSRPPKIHMKHSIYELSSLGVGCGLAQK